MNQSSIQNTMSENGTESIPKKSKKRDYGLEGVDVDSIPPDL